MQMNGIPLERSRGVLRLHRYSLFVVASIVVLIFFGGQVKSTGSGLAVPDWPNTYGHFMFFFPWENMVGGVFWEHMHRMIASVVGILTFGLTIWTYRVENRTWVKRLSLAASIAVLVQGIFGGLTVLHLLPAWISATHGTLAQIYFCMVVLVALVTSGSWRDNPERIPDRPRAAVRNLALATTVTIFLQLVIGAIMRHTESGLAIPDFPTMFGSWVPPLSAERLEAANKELWRLGLLWQQGNSEITFGQMAVHLLHRFWAVVVTGMVIWTFVRISRTQPKERLLRRPALLLLLLVAVQVALGILTILTEKQYTITTLHVVTGAVMLATSLVLAVRARHLLKAPTRLQHSRVTTVAEKVAV